MTSDDTPTLGDLLRDSYEIEREVGRGGTAIVYVARDVKHERRVALKVLRPDLAATLAADRFLLEIRIAARLNHPHILPLHDSGRAGDYIYYVTPFVEEETLRARIERDTRIPVDAVISIARDIASALSYSHAQGVIHRDIKPENVLISGGEAIVADFGIAHAIQHAGETRLTLTGWAVGTRRYVSPEQALGDVDARSDIYSLGCVMYEMLSGELPARVVTPSRPRATRKRREGNSSSLPPLPGDVPRALAAIVSRALQENPDNRFASADEVLDALAELPAEFGISSRTRARRRRRWILPALAAVAGIALIGFGLSAWRGRAARAAGNGVVVFPFLVRGPVDTTLVSPEALVELVSARLTGDVGPRAVDPQVVRQRLSAAEISGRDQPSEERRRGIARAVGAGTVLAGEAVGTRERLTLTARWYSTANADPPTIATASGNSDSLVAIVDRLVAELLLRRAGVTTHRLEALMTRQPPALRRYLAGLESYRRGEYEVAGQQFAEAVRIDSTFALAALQLSSALAMSGDSRGDIRALAAAWRQRGHLTPTLICSRTICSNERSKLIRHWRPCSSTSPSWPY